MQHAHHGAVAASFPAPCFCSCPCPCPCAASPRYVLLFENYIGSIQRVSFIVWMLSVVCFAVLACFCCCLEDNDEYPDSHLL
mmetsp:Transcript_3327/g.7520  ORF Transcript_3327/g.7520 Transcript_3327/m.7520 type:complete len:82 (+) Transcript_3327:351-596(+)